VTTLATQKGLHELGVAEIAAGVASGEISVLALAETLLERIKKYDGVLQSFSYLDPDAVLDEAKTLDAEARAGKLRGPLHGVPFGIKEQFLLEGVATRGDWKDPSPPIAEYTATVVRRLREAGALLMGKLYMVGPSGTPPTRNPWNIEHTPGGSSSGSGAAVGARFIPFSLSEQTAGSGIRPAAYNGVAGLKPTYGRNSRYGMFQMAWSHDHACIIGYSIPDVAKVFAVTSGYDPDDPSSLPVPAANPEINLESMRPPKVGIVRNVFPGYQQPEMNAAIEAAAKKLAEAGATVVDFYLPEEFELAWPLWSVVMACEGHVINAREDAARRAAGQNVPLVSGAPTSRIVPHAIIAKGLGGLIPATYYLQAQRIRRWLREKVDAALASCDAIMMATAPGAAPRDLSTSGDPSLLIPWSHLGNPAVSIPAGLDSQGMPLGLQLVAPNMQDESLLAAAAWCEAVIGRLPAPSMDFVEAAS